jgi:hypothetical protein
VITCLGAKQSPRQLLGQRGAPVVGYPPRCRHCSPLSAPRSHAARAASTEPLCTELSDLVWRHVGHGAPRTFTTQVVAGSTATAIGTMLNA